MNPPVVDLEGLRKIVLSLTGFQADQSVTWDPEPEPFVSPFDRARVILDVFSVTGNHWDEKRRWVSDGTDGYPAGTWVVALVGNRTVVITMRAEAFDKAVEASEIIDRIRLGIIDDPVNDQLNSINLAFSGASAATRIRYQVDERIVNTAVADFTFLAIAQQVTAAVPAGQVGPENRGTYIDTINTDNKVPGDISP